jgi:hypothetical protein
MKTVRISVVRPLEKQEPKTPNELTSDTDIPGWLKVVSVVICGLVAS